MYNPFSLLGKTILVTGASSGIGRAVAVECAKMGARVVITARDEKKLQETQNMMEGKDHMILTADLTIEEELSVLSDKVPELDGMVHCAGISILKPAITIKESDLEKIFSINCFSPMLLTKTLAKSKKLKSSSSLIYISSISGNTNIATALSTYGTSKSALSAYMKYVALELSGKQIRCNAILPGRIETSLIQNKIMDEQQIQQDIAKYPLHRYGQPEEVAYAAIYLLSDASKWVTGTELVIDGGRSLQ